MDSRFFYDSWSSLINSSECIFRLVECTLEFQNPIEQLFTTKQLQETLILLKRVRELSKILNFKH